MGKSNSKRKSGSSAGKVVARKPKVVAIPKMIEIVYLPEEYPMLDMQLCNMIQHFVDEPTVDRGNDLAEHLLRITASLNMIGGGSVAEQTTPEARTVMSAIRAIDDVSKRARAIPGPIQIRDTERMTLLAAKGNLISALEKIPRHVWVAAERDVKVVYAALTARERAKRKMIEKNIPLLGEQIAAGIVEAQKHDLEVAA